MIEISLPLSIPARQFVKNYDGSLTWELVHPYFEKLVHANISTLAQFKEWILHRSELDTILNEDLAWRYVRMTCDTENKQLSESYNYFITVIQQNAADYANKLNQKFVTSSWLSQLDDPRYTNTIRSAKQSIALYRERNVPLMAQMQTLEQQYGNICGAMTIMHNDKEWTLQQAVKFLKSNDRNVRQSVYNKISGRRLQDQPTLDTLMDKLVALRTEIANNAGYDNYRDYKFAEMCRFDYSINDCTNFHEAIRSSVLPIEKDFHLARKKILGYETLMPYDLQVDIDGDAPLQPFQSGAEMMDKAIACFSAVHPFLGKCMQQLKELQRIDLDSRKGKAPGGYNYPLYETGVPFIFMNSSGLLRDLVTIVHEGGHAIHSIVTHELPVVDFKNFPSEVAELASMSMELISMEHWDIFFANRDELKRARLQHLEDVLTILPWIACVDKFQHWIYTNASHTAAERAQAWTHIYDTMSDDVVSWQGLEKNKMYLWQKQLHIYEVPFYYIEYGMAQLGAIALWRNYKQNKEQAIEQYIAALRLGYTKSIKEIYETAGVHFDFSETYIRELCDFVKAEIAAIATD